MLGALGTVRDFTGVLSPTGNARWGAALAENKSQSAAEAPADAGSTGLRALVGRLGTVAVVHWKRTIAAALTVAVLMSSIGLAWTYMVSLAIQAEHAKLDRSLEALDKGDYEEARMLVRQVLASGTLPREQFGVPLYVLGAVKTYDADHEAIPEHRRTQYLVAARYLSKASSYGFPPQREKQALVLWGKSLVESLELEQGIEVLLDALAVSPRQGGQLNVAIHRLLAEAYSRPAQPNDELALKHLAEVLSDKSTTDNQRTDALLLKAKILVRINQHDQALKSLVQIPESRQRDPIVLLARGQTQLDGVAAALDRLPIQADGSLPKELQSQVEEAVSLLREAQTQGDQASDIARRTYYLLGRAAALSGDQREALKYFSRTQQQFGDTPEGLAAKLSEADILLHDGDDATALIWYRQILQLGLDPATYRSEVLPIEQLRRRLLEAVSDFVRRGQFAGAIAMLDSFPPLFPKTQELELRGKTLREWGERLVRQSTDPSEKSRELRRTGLLHLREAGIAYEDLAALRFATENYPTDLWNSADCYYLGHTYSQAARILSLYLETEPERLNAQALLRLGQVNLALGRIKESIEAFQECIELYERDNATYQARIECAQAFWRSGDPKEAERLLRVNLSGSRLEPKSPEWRDSLFALGLLQFEESRYDEAIGTLEEAVERYPDDRQALQARYVIGEAYRRWADEPRGKLETARTASEREKLEGLIGERLAKALEQFKLVQSSITLKIENVQDDAPYAAMRRNCYMLEGACLFDLGRYQEAIEAYQNVSSLYPNEPFVLETFVQIANCWQRLDRPANAHGAIQQAQITLQQLPGEANFASTTALSREEWEVLLNNMSQW
ncbi:MAG: tetratricopeptide repeat protein [Pirellulales bacterium]